MTKPLYTREQIRAESKWTPQPPKRCDVCLEKLRHCGCAKPYVGKRRDDDLPMESDWMR